MATGSMSPVAIQQFFDQNGDPLSGGKLSFYQAGTSTPIPAYADVALTTPLSNPVVLDAAGRAPELYLAALSYKQVLQDASNVTLWTADNVMSAGALAAQALQPTILTLTSTGTAANIDIAATYERIIVCSNNADLTLTGVLNGRDGDNLLIVSIGSGNVFLKHEDATSGATARFSNQVRSGPT